MDSGSQDVSRFSSVDKANLRRYLERLSEYMKGSYRGFRIGSSTAGGGVQLFSRVPRMECRFLASKQWLKRVLETIILMFFAESRRIRTFFRYHDLILNSVLVASSRNRQRRNRQLVTGSCEDAWGVSMSTYLTTGNGYMATAVIPLTTLCK